MKDTPAMTKRRLGSWGVHTVYEIKEGSDFYWTIESTRSTFAKFTNRKSFDQWCKDASFIPEK